MTINKKKVLIGIGVFFVVLFLLEIYLPKSFLKKDIVLYNLERGSSYKEIARDLERRGIIKNAQFFKFYVLVTLQYSKLQAGNYELSESMSITDIVKKFIAGDIVKQRITVIEGWDIEDIAKNLAEKEIYSKENFILATKKDWSTCSASAQSSNQISDCSGFSFEFLNDKPKNVSLEGYLFPDTYYLSEKSLPEELIKFALSNLDKKLTLELRQEISRQKKSLFQIITMASMLEKEVQTLENKKVVSGILWKRIKEGIPLQVDATINYVTGKSDKKVAINDTKIDSPYNTYKYYGLPLGPISNPGMDSILATIYPESSDYWYYLSADGTGKTIFSKTLEEHIEAQRQYFK